MHAQTIAPVRIKRVLLRRASLVFAVAVVLRVTWLLLISTQHDLCELGRPRGDMVRYTLMARTWLGESMAGASTNGDSAFDRAILFSGPGYGAFLAVVFGLFGVARWPVFIIQVLLSSVNCVLIFALAYALIRKPRVALLAGLVGAGSLTAVTSSCVLLTETLFFFFHACSVLCLVLAFRHHHWRWYLASALLGGLGVYIRAVTQFWPIVMMALGVMVAIASPIIPRRRIIGRCLVASLVMAAIVLMWFGWNYSRHGVFAFSENGIYAARYCWIARALASLDPKETPRSLRDKWDLLRRPTFAQRYQDDKKAIVAALRQHPLLMAKSFVKNVYANATRGSDVDPMQLPEYAALWKAIRPIQRYRFGKILLVVVIATLAGLLMRPATRATGLILAVTYFYFVVISGFQFWTGSRVCYPAQLSWAILLAVAIEWALAVPKLLRWRHADSTALCAADTVGRPVG